MSMRENKRLYATVFLSNKINSIGQINIDGVVLNYKCENEELTDGLWKYTLSLDSNELMNYIGFATDESELDEIIGDIEYDIECNPKRISNYTDKELFYF